MPEPDTDRGEGADEYGYPYGPAAFDDEDLAEDEREPELVPAWAMRLWRRFAAPSSRPDRSPALDRERHGRLDRLDLWLLVAIVIAGLTLRIYRLDEPTGMHFDEVYHARTGAEFLQDWRYGIPHDIYEWTHPHVAKYAIAGGLYFLSDHQVKATSSLGVPVTDAAIQTRLEPVTATGQETDALALARTNPSSRLGDRVFVATGSEVRAYDLDTRVQEASFAVPGSSALLVSASDSKLYVGTGGGDIYSIDTDALDRIRLHLAGAGLPQPVKELTALGFPVRKLFVTDSLMLALGPEGQIVSIDLPAHTVVARTTLDGASDFADMGTINVLVAIQGQVRNVDAEAQAIASAVPGSDVRALTAQLSADVPAGTEIKLSPGGPFADAQIAAVQALIDQNELPGIKIQSSVPRVVVAATAGLVTIEARHLSDPFTLPVPGTPKAIVFAADGQKAYVAAGPNLDVFTVNKADGQQPSSLSLDRALRMPGSVERVYYDPGNKVVQVLGRTPDGKGWTSYAVESSGDSVFSDARLPFEPVAWAADVTASIPTADRESLLVFDAAGTVASIDIGQFSFAWRIVGVFFGVLMIACLYLLARVLFRRRTVGLLVAAFALTDGMFFVQSRIAMNDTYVGGLLLVAYVLFAMLWLGVWRNRWAFWVAMPVIGLFLGLALASKWVALYAIASIGMLILFRSALGRILVVIAMALGTGVLGYLALSETPYLNGADFKPVFYLLLGLTAVVALGGVYLVRRARTTPDRVLVAAVAAVATLAALGLTLLQSPPAAKNGGPNFTFFIIMLAVTSIAAAVVAYRPIAWTREEMWFAIGAGALGGLVALFLGRNGSALLLLAGAALMVVPGWAFYVAGRAGFGPLAPPVPAGDPSLYADPPAKPADWWLRLGSGFGVPAVWMGISLLVLPLTIYVASYIPWSMPWQPQTDQAVADYHGYHLPVLICFTYDRQNPDRCANGWPNGHDGQTLTQLTQQMYNYHNDLREPHAASSPWWAWPADLKPVWFESVVYADKTKSMIYDGGNLPMWWLGIPAMAFLAWQAFRRRSLALTLVGVAFFWQWLSWARIDRASFQYHFYTALPFYLLALAYFVAELWHGPSRRTWVLARLAAAAVALGAPFLWLVRYPLCGLARVTVGPDVTDAYWKNLTCGSSDLGSVPIDTRIVLIAGILIVALTVLLIAFRRVERQQAESGEGGWGWLVQLSAPVVVAGILLLLVGNLIPSGETVLVSVPSATTELIGLLEFPVGAVIAWIALTSRDPRRFTLAVVAAAVIAFTALYPNLSALPLPGDDKTLNLADIYNGILPTWFYGFQFGVNQEQSQQVQLLGENSLLLFAGVLAVAAVIGYAAWVRRVVDGYRRLRRLESEPDREPEREPEGI